MSTHVNIKSLDCNSVMTRMLSTDTLVSGLAPLAASAEGKAKDAETHDTEVT